MKLSVEYQIIQHFGGSVAPSHLLIQTASGRGNRFFAMSRQNGNFGGFELRFYEETNAEFLLAELIDGRETLGKAIALAVNHLLELLPLAFRRQFRRSTSLAHCHRFGRDFNSMDTLFVEKVLLLSVEFTILLM